MPEAMSDNATENALPPVVLWAQRKDRVLLTMILENCSNPVIDMTENSLHFKGTGGTENQPHEVTMEFYAAICPETSKYFVGGREISFTLKKKNPDASFWPRLLKDQKKVHYIKTDFDRWRDEDDSDADEPADDFNLEQMMGSMGGLGGGDTGLDMDKDEEDSDDDDLPDLN
ncbi:co-chaperone protein daf-41-like [Gigantopelta aegis]|uniref:co-chaperone protein daf-41-like n=1 Tax=Gigantopelta aegis TaxID=1735272 RepID=UPI001B88DC23|nr:co-chaperone protein daf-41-like [Gigantopelta aegis]